MSISVSFAESFFESVADLTPEEQAQVNAAVIAFLRDRTNPALKLHPCTKPRDRGFWVVKSSWVMRIILHKLSDSWLFLYADHHDRAYNWANRRQIDNHDGMLSVVKIEERVEERVVEIVSHQAPATFADYDDAYLRSLGVPQGLMPALREVRNEEQLLAICDRLPTGTSDRLVSLVYGEFPLPPRKAVTTGETAAAQPAVVAEPRDERPLRALIRNRLASEQGT